MSTLSARLTQAPSEVKRWMLDYTAQVTQGETIVGLTVTVTPIGTVPMGSPAVVINNIVIAPGATQAIFYAQGGADGQNYEAVFLATTSIGQVFEDVVEIDIVEKS